MYRTPVPPARQDGYDQVPAFVQQREDLAYGAKCLYGVLQSVQRMKIAPDYRWLANELHASVRSIIRWVKQLVAAGLIAVRRRGQGLTNLFVVLARVTSGHASVPAPGMTASQPRPEDSFNKKKTGNNRTTGTRYKDFDASNYFETSEGYIVCRG